MLYKKVGKVVWFCIVSLSFAVAAQAEVVVRHDIDVKLKPSDRRLDASDVVRIDNLRRTTLSVTLNAGLKLTSDDKNILQIKSIKATAAMAAQFSVPLKQYSIQFRKPVQQFRLRYSGELSAKESDDERSNASGIASDNVSLSSAQAWFPTFYHDELVSFSLRVSMPKSWYSVSQGSRIERKVHGNEVTDVWRVTQPQPDIYLVAAAFVEYRVEDDGVNASVYLRQDDAALAQKYLNASVRYIKFYQELIGPYPYEKFSTVENNWNSGLGMPSFTLLGSRILRFPFILTSSFPHEILHNWWGNSVYVNFYKGNWSEGLTTYLADHLFKEQSGEAAQYRLSMLQRYHDFVDQNGDFSIADFQSRSDQRTLAVGYDKTAMMFHMLRLQLGEQRFKEALRYLYQKQRFHVTSFKDLERRFSEVSEIDLSRFFSQWIDRVGAPELKVEQLDARKTGDSFLLTLTLTQSQSGAPYQLLVPMWIWYDGVKSPQREMLNLSQKQQSFRFIVKSAPIRVDIDPRFDVFRRLDSQEIPAALSQGFGAKNVLMILPKQADQSVYDAYRSLAEQWKKNVESAEILDDDQLANLPANTNVWIIGWENRFRHLISNSATGQRINTWNDKMRLANEIIRKGDKAVVIAGRRKDDSNHSLLWLAASQADVINALARKLPHYSTYSYLVFDEKKVSNILKGKWLLENTPMNFYLGAKQLHYATIPHRPPLSKLPSQ